LKRGTILNPDLSYLLATLGHMDKIVVADCGLPIPEYVNRIDLTLKRGVPTFLTVFKTLLSEMAVEKVLMAEEIKTKNPKMKKQIIDLIADHIEVEYIPHKLFKERVSGSKGVVRTGEITPFSNIIIVAGVDFDGK
jgi:D-ribose pyranase